MRLLKLTEEAGEVAGAFLGVRGLNRRKGVCRTRDDLLDELSDVIITAAVAMNGSSPIPGRPGITSNGAGPRQHYPGVMFRPAT